MQLRRELRSFILKDHISSWTRFRILRLMMTDSARQKWLPKQQMWLFSMWDSIQQSRVNREIQEMHLLAEIKHHCSFWNHREDLWIEFYQQVSRLSSYVIQEALWILVLKMRSAMRLSRVGIVARQVVRLLQISFSVMRFQVENFQ